MLWALTVEFMALLEQFASAQFAQEATSGLEVAHDAAQQPGADGQPKALGHRPRVDVAEIKGANL